MFANASVYSRFHSMQVRDAKQLLARIVPALRFEKQGEIVMDVGCGTGDTTLNHLLPSLPPEAVQSVIGIDVLPSMIEFASTHRHHPKIIYHQADIENSDTLSRWNGKVSKMFSIHCFNWTKDQKKALTNSFRLLRAGGEFVSVFAISSNFWDCLPEIKNNSKWNKYLERAETGIPESHLQKHENLYYKDLLTNVGFDILICEVEAKAFGYASDAETREAFGSRCAFTSYIPEELRESFKDDLFDTVVRRLGRDEEGRVIHRYKALTLHLCKK